MRLIGHKGADSIKPGNTVASFEAAVAAGVDTIELDLVRPRADFVHHEDWRRAKAGPVAKPGGPLLIAHDWGDARRRQPLTFSEGMDAFLAPPLDGVRIDIDLKLAGREDEVVDGLRERDLLDRASISTMEVSSLREIARLEPRLRRGWTVPRIRRDWNSIAWAKPVVVAGLLSLRRRLPRVVRRRGPALGVAELWSYHPVINAALVRACRDAGLQLIAWTVDDPGRMRELAALGVDGICSNDPRLFAAL